MSVEKIKDKIFFSEKFVVLKEKVKNLSINQPIVLQGIAGSLLAFVAAQVFEERQKQVVVVASDEDRAEKLRDDCALLLGERNVLYLGTRPRHQAQSLDMSASVAQIETLKLLSSNARVLVVASPQSIVEKVPSPETFRQKIIELHVAREYNFQQLIKRLEELGFEKKGFVEGYGDVAIRGGIVDVFPYAGENPLRIEFWGDTIQSIREFDVLSQRSIKELQTANIIPALTGDSQNPDDGSHVENSFDKELSASMFDYLQSDAIVILDEPAIIEREVNELFNEGSTNLFTFQEISEQAANFPLILNSLLGVSQSEIHNSQPLITVDFQCQQQPSFNGSINALVDNLGKLSRNGYQIVLLCDTESEKKRLNELIEEVLTLPKEAEHGSRFEIQTLDQHTSVDECETSVLNNQAPGSALEIFSYEIFQETIHLGFIYHPARLAVFTEHEIFGRLKRRGIAKRHRFKGFTQKELQQLKRSDYVVHVDHGIGMFDGLKKINVGGVEQEVIKLLFLENDVLYVNLNFINRVQKYSSNEGHVPRLNKLGTAEWERAKERAKRRIKDIARDIITLYARRKNEKGFTFSPDTHWQKELEASFMYEDTADQAKATLDVKNDMEDSSPMDRLVCGDVGFGKTEVAVRAAFKAVMDGKQVAVLVPTTILAIQHYHTFHDRLSRYTARIEHITRFKSTKEQKSIVEGMRQGSVDIVIGTHRLLSKDIAFKDLGLLVIDEEHRFGVAAKEKLRQLKASVDTLALTATPIPRTLHFSLIGARDLSLMTTPPRNRLPIITEIIAADSHGRQIHWRIIREAIIRELHRGGQIYFVHDRVNTIESVVEQLRRHAPEARVHIAHGQMSGHELEKTMLDFLEKKYDVLVCTKIIESGLDIPNVNTIIINRADMFGLAELYQLRGRVGRSNVQAYAYLLTPPLSVMPKLTLRRLQAIEEFTELGSGFNLAMRDLEIRGAGNLLGAEQSGYIMEMGFEMYERIVREAVEELKQEEFEEVFQDSSLKSQVGFKLETANVKPETVVDSDVEALIPNFYIESDAERLDLYRRLYKTATTEELLSMRLELQDRFGEYPEEVENLFQLVELRLAADRAGFPKISLKGSTLAITLPPESDEKFYGSPAGIVAGKPGDDEAPFQKLMKRIVEDTTKSIQLKQVGKELTVQMKLTAIDNIQERLGEAKSKLERIISAITV